MPVLMHGKACGTTGQRTRVHANLSVPLLADRMRGLQRTMVRSWCCRARSRLRL